MLNKFFKSPHIFWVVFTIFLITYTITTHIPKPQGMTLTNGDEPHYLLMTYGLLENGNINNLKDLYNRKVYLPWYNSSQLVGHLVGLGEKTYAYHPIGLSILLLPGFALAGMEGAVFTLLTITAFGLALMYKVLNYYIDKKDSFLTTLLIGLTVPVGTYAGLIYPETMVFFFVCFLMYIVLNKSFKLSGLSFMLTLLFISYLPVLHPKFIVLSLIFLAFINLAQSRKIKIWSLVLFNLLFIVIVSLYIWWLWIYYDGRLFEALKAIAAGTKLSIFEIPSGLLGATVDRENGFLIYSPILIYSIYGILPSVVKALKQSFQKALYTIFPTVLAVVFTLFYAMFPYIIGGASPSGRYSLPVIPAMALLLAYAFKKKLINPYQKFMIAIFSLYSVLVFTILSVNPILTIPFGEENRLFFFLFKGNAHALINVHLPNLSKYYRQIPVVDYLKAIIVMSALIIVTSANINFRKLKTKSSDLK